MARKMRPENLWAKKNICPRCGHEIHSPYCDFCDKYLTSKY